MTQIIIRRSAQSDDHGLPTDLPPVLRRIYAARGLDSPDALDQSLKHLIPFNKLSGIDRATDLLIRALQEKQRIVVVGDFDADGATSCALCVGILRSMGAHYVRYLVPNRFEYGYGLTPEIVEVAAQREPDLIITVDNGISSVEGVQAARQQGISVLITDHHLPGSELPDADAIVNPNLPDDSFPSKYLAGVGVAFYVMLALRTRLRERGWFTQQGIVEPNLADYLDLVALGTVADVVPLDRNNRILVAQGLSRIRAQRCRPGILALLRVAGRNPGRSVASDLGFAVAPRLNAAGRLDDMSLGIECLMVEDFVTADKLARELDELNRERRKIESDMQTQAMDAIQALHLNTMALPTGLCLFDEKWHQGVIGILASRIKERLHRPVIAFAPTNESELKGSARSVSGVHIRDVLDAIAARHPGLILRFGGHAMAAGLSLERDNFDAFQKAFDNEVSSHLSADDLNGVIVSDGNLDATELNLDTAEQLRNGGPWGQGFPEPLFDDLFEVVNTRVVGEHHLKLVLRLQDHDTVTDAIAFGQGSRREELASGLVRVAYRLDANEYRGVSSAQLMVEYIESIGRN